MASTWPQSSFGASPLRRMLVHDESAGLREGESRAFAAQLAGTNDPLRIVLAWTDPPPTAGAGRQLVNDLDLVVTLSDGRVLRAGPGVPPNRLDNMESLLLASGSYVPGALRVDVIAASVPGQPSLPGSDVQSFAVVIVGEGADACLRVHACRRAARRERSPP